MLSNHLKTAINRWSNSFSRPLVPPMLLKNSEILETEDDGAKLIYLKFLYGIQTGTYSTRPTDGGVGNIIKDTSEESLWLYSMDHEEVPDGFKEKKYDLGIIGTGDIRKCGTCKGHGEVRCRTCGGKIRWTSKDFEGNRIDNVCSCGNGKQKCGTCSGYGELEIIIKVRKQFKVFQTKNSQYTGEVPKERIKRITGELVFEQVYDYPMEIVKEMLVGGIDSDEFDTLNDSVLTYLKKSVKDQLAQTDIDIEKIHSQLDDLFNTMPNPGKENKVLEYESMPVRVMVRVENAPVKQVDYKYKENKYSIWVYGKENSVWKKKVPASFNYKVIILLILMLGVIGTGIIYSI